MPDEARGPGWWLASVKVTHDGKAWIAQFRNPGTGYVVAGKGVTVSLAVDAVFASALKAAPPKYFENAALED